MGLDEFSAPFLRSSDVRLCFDRVNLKFWQVSTLKFKDNPYQLLIRVQISIKKLKTFSYFPYSNLSYALTSQTQNTSQKYVKFQTTFVQL